MTTTSDQPIYFWREYGSEWAFLSQWYPSSFHAADKSITFVTAEQYMMYQKAILFSDPTTAASILATSSPLEQKALGRAVKNFDNKTWLATRERIVGDGSYYKFKNALEKVEGRELKVMLLETGEKELVEASPYDRIWGVGFREEEAEGKREEWGLNLLGKALMRTRERLRGETEGEEKTPEA